MTEIQGLTLQGIKVFIEIRINFFWMHIHVLMQRCLLRMFRMIQLMESGRPNLVPKKKVIRGNLKKGQLNGP